MNYFCKIEQTTYACDIVSVNWKENLAVVIVEGKIHTVSLYKLVMQTSLFEQTSFDEVVTATKLEFYSVNRK